MPLPKHKVTILSMNQKRKRHSQTKNAELPQAKRAKVPGHSLLNAHTVNEDCKTITISLGNKPVALPECDGPKTQPFASGSIKIKFDRRIGDHNSRHAYVYRVIINERAYALKLFLTWDVTFGPFISSWHADGLEMTYERIRQHYEPFFNECRAYGRIKEKKLTERCWECYGYLRIPCHLRPALEKATGDLDWQARNSTEPDKPEQLKYDIYGLVKELAPNGPPIVPRIRSVRKMRGDLRLLNRNGIFNRDIADRNYMQGRIIDFSSAITTPHIWFEIPCNRKAAYYLAARDGREFDDMVMDAGIKTKAKAWEVDYEMQDRTRAGRRRRVDKGLPNSPLWQLGDSPDEWVEPYSDYGSDAG